jgi:superfamily II DNA helicase RecQ
LNKHCLLSVTGHAYGIEGILMAEDKIPYRSKIVKYGLEEKVVKMRQNGMSYEDITDAINKSGALPDGEEISIYSVQRFFKHVPEINKALVKQDKRRLLKVVNNHIDIIQETQQLYNKTKSILAQMEEQAQEDEDGGINPYHYKAILSEMRESLKLMMELQKEIADAETVKQFMQIVIDTVQEVAPSALPVLLERLKIKKGSAYFTNNNVAAQDWQGNDD